MEFKPERQLDPEDFPTGVRYIDCTHYSDCPLCSAPKGFLCQTPSGVKAPFPHAKRLKKFNLMRLSGSLR